MLLKSSGTRVLFDAKPCRYCNISIVHILTTNVSNPNQCHRSDRNKNSYIRIVTEKSRPIFYTEPTSYPNEGKNILSSKWNKTYSQNEIVFNHRRINPRLPRIVGRYNLSPRGQKHRLHTENLKRNKCNDRAVTRISLHLEGSASRDQVENNHCSSVL